jgi:hypothetical protein
MSKSLLIFWSVLSFIVSGLFIFYGLLIFQLEKVPAIAFYSSVVAICYGLTTIYLLSQTWAKPSKNYAKFTGYLVVFMFVIQTVLNFDVGMISGMEWTGLVVMALTLSINWLSVKFVSEHRNEA